jgi:hypothetical protein
MNRLTCSDAIHVRCVPVSVRPSIDVVVVVGVRDGGALIVATVNMNMVATLSRYY